MKKGANAPDTIDLSTFEMFASRQFVDWIREQKISVGFSTYQSGKVFLVGNNPTGQLSVFERTFNRPMGMWTDGEALWLASLYELVCFRNILEPGALQDGYDRLYTPQAVYITADLDIHDVAIAANGKPVFVNTLFSCLATTGEHYSFTPVWKPKFISRYASEDRCHLNGLAMRDGKPAYVTAVATTDVVDGWRAHRAKGGVVIDVASQDIVANGLSMPHSPRWHRGKLWVANSGAGEFGFVDLHTGKFECVAFLPGYIRGMSMHGDFALLGLSKARQNKTFQGLPLDDALSAKQAEAQCGVYVVDLRTGDIAHFLKIECQITELYDVVVFPQVARPSMIGFRNDQIRRTISIGPERTIDGITG